jgi:glycosyltransferase involved in cell wall biosynthesis
MTLASVVVTTRDRPSLAARAIRSALQQTLDDLEVIVVDDGSEVPVALTGTDHRVRVVRHQRSRGVCAARNTGLRHASGSWVMFLDDDDELLPDALETSLHAALSSRMTPPVAVVSGIEVVGESGDIVETRLPTHAALESSYPLGRKTHTENTLFLPLDVVRGIGGWDEEVVGWEHDDFLLRLRQRCSVEEMDQVTYRMFDHGGGRLHRDHLRVATGMARTIEKHRITFDAQPDIHARYLAAMGIYYLRAGRWRPALTATSRALLLHPDRRRLIYWLAALAGPQVFESYGRAKRAWASVRRREQRHGDARAGHA